MAGYLVPNESVVMKCGSYLHKCLKGIDHDVCEAVAIHLYPELFKSLFDEELSAQKRHPR